jgi:hypothetical protein
MTIAALLLGAYYFVYQTDYALLGDEFCLRVASNDVLGNPLYGQSCPRSSYAGNVESLHTADKAGAAFFRFTPITGKEAQCPPIAIIVDRKTGEAWLAK